MKENRFSVLTVGWEPDVIRRLADPIEAETGFLFSHLLDKVEADNYPGRRFFNMRSNVGMKLPPVDGVALAALEQPGVPTIHNMILSDPHVRLLQYSDALAYATYLARRLEELFRQIEPSMILGGFDRLHGGLAFAVARKLDIPWFCLNFTTIPPGMAGFCSGLSPDKTASFLPPNPDALRALAERTLTDFETRRLVVPAGLSANDLFMVLQRLPGHVRVFFRAIRHLFARRVDPITEFSVSRMMKEYMRKRLNLLRLPKRDFLQSPPASPFVFIGFHMQPESSIDVWAPFFADQFGLIEQIARATPPSHQVLVKLHKSDADNYSPRQLERLQRLPGVRLVSPFANSREFIEKTSLLLAIQGNIALEAALLGRPVLLFGDSNFVQFPSVTKTKRVTDLPEQIRSKIAEPRPSREAIIRGFMAYLSSYAPACYNNWQYVVPSPAEVAALGDHFRALRQFVEQQRQPVHAGIER